MKRLSKKTSLQESLEEEISDLIYKHKGLRPYKEQFQAGRALAEGNIVNQSTGEGKTISVLIALLLKLREGRKIYIITSNDYLSERDYFYSKDIIEELGYKSIYISKGASSEAYSRDVIYATGQTLIFDYLRGVKAEYDFAIIDEVDYILVECAGHDFSVSDGSSDVKMPAGLFHTCKRLSDGFTAAFSDASAKAEDLMFDANFEADYIADLQTKSVSITLRGLEKLEKLFGSIDKNLMIHEAMTATLLVKHFYLRNSEYIVKDNEIAIIDASNGRIMPGGSNDVFIQTAIEVKEGVRITDKALLCRTCAFPVFFTVFRDFSGISGTAECVPYDFERIYGKSTVKIPDHLPSQRIEKHITFNCDTEKDEYIRELIKNPGNYLLITGSDASSKKYYEMLKSSPGKHVMILDNYNLEDEKEILSKIKHPESVLISSKIVGRGVDISLPEQLGGLNVILSCRFLSEKCERQAIGRCGRNGKPGTAYILTSGDDPVLSLLEDKTREINNILIKKLQDKYEARQFELRRHIFVRSKLYFDQDYSIKQKISGFNDYEELISVVKKSNISGKDYILSITPPLSGRLSSYFKLLLEECYKKLAPYFQAQFLRSCDLMPEKLIDTEKSHEFMEEYIQLGINAIAESFYMAVRTREYAQLQKRKRNLS